MKSNIPLIMILGGEIIVAYIIQECLYVKFELKLEYRYGTII